MPFFSKSDSNKNKYVKNSSGKLQASRNKTVKASTANLKPVFAGLILFSMIGLVLVVQQQLSKQVWFPISEIKISGVIKQTDRGLLKQTVLAQLTDGFFDLNLNFIAQKIERNNWIAQATLRRVWPNKIEVLLREHQAVAVWDEHTLVSANGVLFKVDSTQGFEDLVLINGLERQAKELLLAASQLQDKVSDHDLNLHSVNSKKSGEVIVTFDSQLKAVFSLAQKDTQFDRFEALLNQGFMQQRNNKSLKQLDMRYSNGFSVQWIDEKQASLTHLNSTLRRISGKQNV